MKILRLIVFLVATVFLLGACAGVIEPRLPQEFKGKKQKEDPPLTLIQPLHEACT